MNGVQELEQLKAAGFSGEEIAQHEADQRVELGKAGFSQAEIDKHFGTQPADMKAVEEYFSGVASALQQEATPAEGGPKKAVGFSEYLDAGWQVSVMGLAQREKMPDVTAEEAPWYGRLAANVATLAGDAPSMLGGVVLGGAAGTAAAGPGLGTLIGAGGGGMALPMALREALIQNIKNGSVKDTQDFIDRALAIAWEGGKGFITGATTAGVGKAAGLLPIKGPVAKVGTQLTAELATMTTVGHALEGQLPTAQSFLDGAVVLGGLKGTMHVSGKLMDIYHKTGKLPAEVVQDASVDATIKQSILSTNEQIPTAYKDLVQGAIEEADPTPWAENGKPVTLYHGTDTKFSAFDPKMLGSNTGAKSAEKAVFLTTNKDLAREYAEMVAIPVEHSTAYQKAVAQYDTRANAIRLDKSLTSDQAVKALDALDAEFAPIFDKADAARNIRVLEAHATFKNPMVVDYAGKERTAGDFSALIDRAKAEGHDALIIRNAKDSPSGEGPLADIYAVFDPTQIKMGAPKPEKPARDLTGRSEAEQTVLARVAGEQKKPGYSWDKFYTEVVNDLHPIFKAVEEMGGKDLPVEQHAGKLAQLTRGSIGKADQALEFAIYDPKTLKNIGEGLKDRMRPVAEDLDGWRAYALSKRAVELDQKGIETGIDLAAAKKVVADGKWKKYEAVSQKVTEYQNWLVDNLAEAGILSKEAVAAMKEAHKDYVPFYRLMDEPGAGRGAGVGMRVRDPIKGIKGSERQILDPIESIIKNTYLYAQLADRNMVGRALVELAEKHPQGAEFLMPVPQKLSKVSVSDAEINKFLKEQGIDEQVGEAMSVFRAGGFNPSPDTIVVFRDGKKEVFKVSRDVADAFNKTDRFTAGLLVKVLATPASVLRAGAVLSPDFMARNLARDQLSAFINSDSGYRMVTDSLRGMQQIIGKTEVYQNWLKSGGANAALVNIDRQYIAHKVFKLDEQTGFIGSAVNVVKTPIELLRVASELMENGTRIGEFMRASKGGDKAALLEGGFASREVTLDFSRVGAKTRAVNQITAFWNAHVQGLDRTARKFKEDPMGTTAKVAAAITMPSVLLWWANHDDPRWKQIPDWQKDLFWIVMTDEHVYRIPKPFELGLIFGTLPERALDAVYDADPKAFKGMGETILKNIVPDFLPTAAAPILEQWANRSTLTGHTLIPATLEGLLPQYQATPYTTETAKALGSIIGSVPGLHDSQAASPILAENYLRAWTGGLGMYALQLADVGLRKSGVLPDPVKPADTLADIPFVKAFVVRYPSASAQPIQDFYDRYERNQKVVKTVQYLAQQGNQEAVLIEMTLAPDALLTMTGAREAISNMSKFVRDVYANPEFSRDDKRQLIDAAYYQMMQTAELANALMDEVEKTVPKSLFDDLGVAK